MQQQADICRSLAVLLGATLGCAVLSGCSDGKSKIVVPTYDPAGSAAQALKLFDENQNGSLEAAEITNCPSFLAAMPQVDVDGNGKLTAEEIKGRIAQYRAMNVGLMSVQCQVLRDGIPLPGAKVTFAPEQFLKGTLQPATGVTNDSGWVGLKREGPDYPGVQAGLYRVQVSLVNESGLETIPAQYNTQTTLGVDIAPDVVSLERGLIFHLKTH